MAPVTQLMVSGESRDARTDHHLHVVPRAGPERADLDPALGRRRTVPALVPGSARDNLRR
ncbi:MAG: hypothetical protein ACYC1Z_13505 [Georgenia sp.]